MNHVQNIKNEKLNAFPITGAHITDQSPDLANTSALFDWSEVSCISITVVQ